VADKLQYSLKEAQEFVEDSIRRSRKRWEAWRAYEWMFRSGEHQTFADQTTFGTLDFRGLSLDRPVFNLIKPHIELMVETATQQPPKLIVDPYVETEDAKAAAEVDQTVLRFMARRNRLEQHLHQFANDVVKLGTGVLKTGWSRVKGDERQRDERDVLAEIEQLIFDEDQAATREGRARRELSELRDQVAVTWVPVVKDEPYIKRISPYDFHVPVECSELEEARWLAHRMLIPVDELKQYPHVNDKAKINATHHVGDDRADRKPSNELSAGAHTQFQFAEVYEFWDMRSRRYLLFQRGCDVALIDKPFPHDHRFSPFSIGRGSRASQDDFWGIPLIENVARLQMAINVLVTEIIRNAKASGHKHLVDKRVAAANPQLKELLLSDQPDIVAAVDLVGQQTLQEIIHTVQRQPLSGDVWAAYNEVEQAIGKVLGMNEIQMGSLGPSRTAATMGALADGVQNLRGRTLTRPIEEATGHAGLLTLLLCKQNLDGPNDPRTGPYNEIAYKILGDERIELWEAGLDTLQHTEFEVKVEPGSTATNPATDHERGLQLLERIAPALAQNGVSPRRAIAKALTKMGEDPEYLMAEEMQQPEAPAPGGAQGEPGAEMLPPELSMEAPGELDPLAMTGGLPQAAELSGGNALGI